MTRELHKATERGKGDFGWLKTRYSFSFANYDNPERSGVGALRVLNDDIIDAGKGFDKHPHDNMEIITIVTEGALEHKDTLGGQGIIKPGDVQVMSAGMGIEHAEFNHSKTAPLKLFQMWIEPKEYDVKPRYEQRTFDEKKAQNALSLIVSGKKEKDALVINQDAKIFQGRFDAGKTLDYSLGNDRIAFLFIIKGEAKVGDIILKERDALEVEEEKHLVLAFTKSTRLLLFDLPPSADG